MDRIGRRSSIFGGDDSDDNDGTAGSKYPYGWFVIPVVVAIALACVVMLLRYRRKKLVRTMNGYRNNALRQDIETMGPPRHHRPWNLASRTNSNVPYAGYYNSSSGGGGAALGPGPGPGPGLVGRGPVASGQNEGLNEFGEAPPAYTARQKQQSAVEAIELNNMGRSQVDMIVPPPAVATTTTATPIATLPAQSSPPPYSEAQQTNTSPPPLLGPPVGSPQDGLERPPPAVLGSR
ncbi:hypothetical protein SLS62_004030 [Diatrype stigma]|uniref:Uncharacterized protein n=1 Tax=Diatrype stigma TaxID=117547 RepID=A0AAN9YTF6_9PEZI